MTETKDEAELRKTVADANAAEAAAQKARREEAEAASPSAIADRAAKAGADAAKASADRFAPFVPDLTKVSRGDLTVASGGEPTAGTGLAGQAIGNAAAKVAAEVVREFGSDDWSILVTEEVDLASSDALYYDVCYALRRLSALASEAMEATQPSVEDGYRGNRMGILPLIAAGPAAVAAVAAALPGVLSLLSHPRTITTGTVTVSDVAAAMAVAGKLKGNNDKRRVAHDRFRLLPRAGNVQGAVERLYGLREQLAKRKLALALESQPGQSEVAQDLAASLALVTKIIDSIDHYLESVTTAPPGSTRSPLTNAILREELHSDAPMSVLLVKAESASGMQSVENRLIRDDRFAVVAAATITWSLLDRDGDIRGAGVATGTAQATGTIGKRFELDPSLPPPRGREAGMDRDSATSS